MSGDLHRLIPAIRQWVTGDSNRLESCRAKMFEICQNHIDSGLADSGFLERIVSADHSRFMQAYSEAAVGHELISAGLMLTPTGGHGPDFKFIHNAQTIWVEVICPEPNGITAEWLNPILGEAIYMPADQILLRWTAAIKEKAEKLIGNDRSPGYLDAGVVLPDDAYVIAVNGRLLSGRFASITGITQYPFAVEAVLAVGPLSVHINRNTLKILKSGYDHRPHIARAQRQPVPTDTFFDNRFAPISAVYAVDICETACVGGQKPMAVVHNPNAHNPIPRNLLPANEEYFTTVCDTEYLVHCRPGRSVD